MVKKFRMEQDRGLKFKTVTTLGSNSNHVIQSLFRMLNYKKSQKSLISEISINPKKSQKISKNPAKHLKKSQKILKICNLRNFYKSQKNPKKSQKIPKNPKNPKKSQKISKNPKKSQKSQKIPKIPKNPKKSQKSFDLVHFFGSDLPLA